MVVDTRAENQKEFASNVALLPQSRPSKSAKRILSATHGRPKSSFKSNKEVVQLPNNTKIASKSMPKKQLTNKPSFIQSRLTKTQERPEYELKQREREKKEIINSQLAQNAFVKPQQIGAKKISHDLVKPNLMQNNYKRIKRSFQVDQKFSMNTNTDAVKIDEYIEMNWGNNLLSGNLCRASQKFKKGSIVSLRNESVFNENRKSSFIQKAEKLEQLEKELRFNITSS